MKTLQSVSYNTLEKFATSLFKFVNVAIIASVLGAEGQGTFSYFITIWGTVYVFGSLGMSLASNYFAARAEPEQIAEIIGTMLITLLALPILGALGLIAIDQITPVLDAIEGHNALLFTGIFIHFLTIGLTGILYGLARYREIFWGAVIQHFGMFLFLIAMLFLDRLTIPMAVAAWVGFQGITGLYFLFNVLRVVHFRLAFSWRYLREQAGYGIKAYPFLTMTNLNSRLSHYFITFFLGLEALGIYALALNFTEVIQNIPKAFSRVLLTDVAGTGKISDDAFQNLSGITLLIIAAAGIGAPIFIYFVFPPEYLASIPLVYLLLPSSYFVGVGQNFSYVFFGKGNRLGPAKAVGLALIATAIGGIILIPWLGVTGAALVTSLTGLLFFVLQYRPLARVEPVSLKPSLSWVRHIIASALKRIRKRRGNTPTD